MPTEAKEGTMPSSATITPSGDTTGAADTAAINTALGGVGAGGTVLLGPGDWYTDAPLAIPTGVELAGVKGGINGRTATVPTGSVIHPVAAFSGPVSSTSRPSPACGSGTSPSSTTSAHRRTWMGSPATATSTAWRSCTSRWPLSAATGWPTTSRAASMATGCG